MTELESVTPVELPGDFQDRVFKAIAVQRPAALAYIKEVRRKHPGATPADVMRIIEQHYVRTTTSASAAVGATATIPAVGIPTAIGLGVADLLFFYESTAMFAICMAELRGYRIDDPDRAKVVVLGAMLGEKRKSRVTELVMTALPAGASYTAARMATESTVSRVSPKWGDLLSAAVAGFRARARRDGAGKGGARARGHHWHGADWLQGAAVRRRVHRRRVELLLRDRSGEVLSRGILCTARHVAGVA